MVCEDFRFDLGGPVVWLEDACIHTHTHSIDIDVNSKLSMTY